MAQTLANGKFYLCITPQPANLTQEQYEGLEWLEVKGVGSKPESGTTANIVSYDTLADGVTQKSKGINNAGDGTLEVARIPTDPGQVALRAAAATKFIYATKFVADDAPSGDYLGTTFYNRGVVGGPTHPAGRNEDFILEVFQWGLTQIEIVVNPEAQVAPVNIVAPAMSGAAVQTGVELTAYPGIWSGDPTFLYAWQADDAGNDSFVDIPGATSSTFTPVVGNVGDAIRLEVTAVNGEGTPVVAVSLPSQVQIAA